jgi:hypothetical protein
VFSYGVVLCELIALIDSDPDHLPRTKNFGVDYAAFGRLLDEDDGGENPDSPDLAKNGGQTADLLNGNTTLDESSDQICLGLDKPNNRAAKNVDVEKAHTVSGNMRNFGSAQSSDQHEGGHRNVDCPTALLRLALSCVRINPTTRPDFEVKMA